MTIQLLGTSHISQESVHEIQRAVEEGKPDIIAVELDIQRAIALLQNQKNRLSISHIRHIGVKGYIFAKVGQIVQQKLGKVVGISPGSEMKAALMIAKKKKINVAFIDQPIRITLKKFSKALTWKEKGKFLADFFKGIFQPKKQAREMGLGQLDLRKVPTQELIIKMMSRLKNRYPSIYKTIVEDRNVYMVKSLVKLVRKNPENKILAIVGAGHIEGMKELLLKVDIL